MDKGIGFNRTVFRSWLDATAAFCAETDDAEQLRARLGPVVAQHLTGDEARRKTIDVLLNIWLKTRDAVPRLRDWAVEWFHMSPAVSDRLWLHYGLALSAYSFFRECVATVGRQSRLEAAVTTRMVKDRMAAEMGHLGSLDRSVERVVASLRDWEVLTDTPQRYVYRPQRRAFEASSPDLETWMLACSLHAHPAEELPFADLLRLPELFPFRFTATVKALRTDPRFDVQRRGPGWEMVRLTSSRLR
ncbi:MAG: hypothetical protein ACOC8C_02280 [Chloroflexota bacterium]